MTQDQESTVAETVNDYVEGMFTESHELIGSTSGDITPDQMFRLNKIQEELTSLIIEQVNQNQ